MRHLGAVVILASLPSLVAAGQTASRQEQDKERGKAQRVTAQFAAQRVATWINAVHAHTAGAVDDPLTTVASWPPEQFGLVLKQVSLAADAARLLRLGLVLHTDIALWERDALAGKPGGSVVLLDGQVTQYLGRSAHWPIARQIAAKLAQRPGDGPRVAAWYRATAAIMQEWRDVDLLGKHLEAGQALFLDDPVLALHQGVLRQIFGDARLEEYLSRRGTTQGFGEAPAASRLGPAMKIEGSFTIYLPKPSASRAGLPNVTRVELVVAARELRRALGLDPALHEARIRLAHVLSRLGDYRQATEVVRPALEAPLSPFLEFYAAIVLGRSAEQLGEYDEAGAAYARAAACFPGAESASIGLSRVALAQGRAADGLKILVEAVGPDATEQSDPWLDYLEYHEPDGETQLKAWWGNLK